MLAEEGPDEDVPVKHPSASATRPDSAFGAPPDLPTASIASRIAPELPVYPPRLQSGVTDRTTSTDVR